MLADDFRVAVASEIGEIWRFIVYPIEHTVAHPCHVLCTRIFEPRGVLPREADDQNIVALVAIEIVYEGEEVVRVAGGIESFRIIITMAIREGRARIPPRSGDQIHLAVAIQVA